MKKSLRFFTLASLGAMALFAGFVVACGDDDDTTIPPGTDSGQDATTKSDTGAPSDAGDGGVTELGDASAVLAYEARIENAICSSFSRCCFGDPNLQNGQAIDAGPGVDGGHYVSAQCKATVVNSGFEFSSLGFADIDAGTIRLDPAAAEDCITKLSNLSCSLTGAELIAARSVCFNAFVGTKALGDSCAVSLDCPVGAVCQPNGDGGLDDAGSIIDAGATCVALKGQGGNCAIFPLPPEPIADAGDPVHIEWVGVQAQNAVLSEQACSTRGGGDTHLRCATYDSTLITDGNPNGFPPRSQWTCQPLVANGNDCDSTVWCSEGVCNGSTFVCESPSDYFGGGCAGAVE